MHKDRKEMTLHDYNNAVSTVVDFACQLDNSIKPISIYQNGNIGTFGVSDIDLIFVFEDTFYNGKLFLEKYNKSIEKIDNKNIFFIHSPFIVNKSVFKNIPYYSYNPPGALRCIFGESFDFFSAYPSSIQSILISIEFILFRIIQLINNLISGNVSLNGILVRGHSLIHSICLAKIAGVKLDKSYFKYFQKIEYLRSNMHIENNAAVQNDEILSLYKGIINEFYYIYKKFCFAINNLTFFYLPKNDYYVYDNNTIIENIFNDNIDLSVNIDGKSGKLYVQGLDFSCQMLRDIYFNVPDFSSYILDSSFLKECKSRAKFHMEQWEWNFKNFGKIHSGLSAVPCVAGEEARKLAESILLNP
ncbi:hypothetical protein [Desulfonatronum thiodismutans]|uniref:hypothetical protein n=1 Tax=Desulfonatronum thiodismutans TaxID=159290 RepID=UPI0012697FDF|nr:hypothetical protein [Desulfonatronum thiodismutans]